RADELAYDPRDGLLLVINNASDPPFGTLIKVDKTTGALTIVTNIEFDAAHGVDATNGAEQPVWDPGTGKFYLSIPQIGPPASHGGVLRISTTGTVEATYPVEVCSPAGLALGPKEDLLVGCNTVFDTAGGVWTANADKDINSAKPRYVILDAKTGNIDKILFDVGPGDEVWFNKGDGNYYTASSGSPLAPNAITPPRSPVGTAVTAPVLTAQGAAILGVIDAEKQKLLQLVPTLNVPARVAPAPNPHPAGTAHSVADMPDCVPRSFVRALRIAERVGDVQARARTQPLHGRPLGLLFHPHRPRPLHSRSSNIVSHRPARRSHCSSQSRRCAVFAPP